MPAALASRTASLSRSSASTRLRSASPIFARDERHPVGEPARHQVEELPAMTVRVIEHRVQRVRCRQCGRRARGELPGEVMSSACGPRLQAALLALGRRQLCWSHLKRDFAAHAEGLAAEKEFGERGLELCERVFWAWQIYQHTGERREPKRTTRSLQRTYKPTIRSFAAKRAR